MAPDSGFPAKIAVARQIQAFDIEALQELNEREDLCAGRQQSFEFSGVDDCDRLSAAHGDVLRSLVMGAPDDFAEFRLRLLQLPYRGVWSSGCGGASDSRVVVRFGATIFSPRFARCGRVASVL